MGIRASRILSVSFFLLISTLLYAQDKPAVHKINGKKYYLHVVEKGNTLYGIHKLYNVDVEQIIAENPIVKEAGLKVNQTLLIPVTADNKKDLGGAVEMTEEYVVHQVKPKETLYSISKHYDCSLEDVLNANPEVRELGLRSGDEIRIPVKSAKVEEVSHVEVAEPDTLKAHTVGKGETLYALGQKYNVKVEQLIEFNHGLPFGLKEGMVLRIPGTFVIVDLPKDAVPAEPVDTTEVLQTGDTTDLNLVMLLPFSPVFPDSATRDNFKINEAERIALNFYRGFQYAIDEFGSERYRLKVFDSGKDTFAIRELLKEPIIDSAHVVIGPFYTEQFQKVADYLSPRGIPVICPVPKPSKILFQRPNSIKTTPSQTMQLSSLAEYLAQNYKDSNLVVVNSNKFEDQENLEFFKSQYTRALNLPDTFVDDAIREIKLWDINLETIKMRLPDSGSYTLVVPSTNKVFYTKLLGGMYEVVYEADSMYEFRIIGMEGWKRSVKDFDINHVHKLNLTLPLSNHLDFNDYRVHNFFGRFAVDKGFEPDEYVLAGYDLGEYLCAQLNTSADSWFSSPETTFHDGLISDFSFQRKLQGSGVENSVIHLYEYDNYKMKRIATWPSVKK